MNTPGGPRIVLDDDCSLQEGRKNVKESINNALLIEAVALERAQPNFLSGTNDANPAEFFKMKQLLSSVGLHKKRMVIC